MSAQSTVDNTQPEIKEQSHQKSSQMHSHHCQHDLQHHESPQKLSPQQELKKFAALMKNFRHKHPQCIPIFFRKHQAAPKEFPSPKVPLILFKKDLPIEQAMYNLYNQIQTKGLYFFCTRFDAKQKKIKFVILKPGETIENIYRKYGRDDHLTLIYGDKNIGMAGVNRMEKWLIRILVFILLVWLVIIGYPLYIAYDHGGVDAVWDTLSLVLKKATGFGSDNDQMPSNETLNVQRKQEARQQRLEALKSGDLLNEDELMAELEKINRNDESVWTSEQGRIDNPPTSQQNEF